MQFLNGSETVDVPVERVIVAGWTGRDAKAVQHHIDELAAIGVAPPSTTPLYYEVSHSLLTQEASIQVLGGATSGEAEPLLINQSGKLWIGLASDHTDRDLETTSVATSKQACAKVCAAEIWEFDAVLAHVDQLKLRSWIKDDGEWQLYQDGSLSQIMPLASLATRLEGRAHSAMLCGTLPAIGGVRAAKCFRAELHDPVLDRSITLEYQATALRIVS